MNKALVYELLGNEFICGKSSVLPFCINSILRIWEEQEETEKNKQEVIFWEQIVYYMADLYYFQKEKEMYAKFLRVEKNIEVLF